MRIHYALEHEFIYQNNKLCDYSSCGYKIFDILIHHKGLFVENILEMWVCYKECENVFLCKWKETFTYGRRKKKKRNVRMFLIEQSRNLSARNVGRLPKESDGKIIQDSMWKICQKILYKI